MPGTAGFGAKCATGTVILYPWGGAGVQDRTIGTCGPAKAGENPPSGADGKGGLARFPRGKMRGA